MCLKVFVTAVFGSSEPFYFGKWACPVGAIPHYDRLSDNKNECINYIYMEVHYKHAACHIHALTRCRSLTTAWY